MTDTHIGGDVNKTTDATYILRLYVTGNAPNSRNARANLPLILERYHPGPFELEVIDVLKDPARALGDNILVTPTLVKLGPGPLCQIIGDLGEHDHVVAALDL